MDEIQIDDKLKIMKFSLLKHTQFLFLLNMILVSKSMDLYLFLMFMRYFLIFCFSNQQEAEMFLLSFPLPADMSNPMGFPM